VNLDPALLEILACPNCHGQLTADEAAERLVCNDCGYRYPVRDDIPVMLIDEADKPADKPGEAAGAASDSA
jgi:uncharacterized protein YbaR (Trm112 family)